MSERQDIEHAITALEAQRRALGDRAVDTALGLLRERHAALLTDSERRTQISVLFADISGFTALSYGMDPEDLREAMNQVWRRVDAAITARGGRIDKHLGDGVMALFGATAAREDDPERAVHAALDIQRALRELAASLDDSRAMAMRIGIHTGPVVLGAVGSNAEFTAMGETVNLASRIEQSAPVGGILLSHDTYQHVRDSIDVTPLKPAVVKGRAAPLQLYVVQGVKPRTARFVRRTFEGIETPLVGRDADMGELQSILRAARERGEGRLVVVAGEAGIGKSRLAQAFKEWTGLMREPLRVFRGRISIEGSEQPYALLRDMLVDCFELPLRASPEEMGRKLVSGIGSLMGVSAEEHAHFIGQLVGLEFPDSPYLRGMRERQLRDRAFRCLAAMFESATRAMPAVIILEDVHGADDGSLDALEHLAASCRAMPLVILCLARRQLFERRPGWAEEQDGISCIELERLSDAASRSLVTELLCRVRELPRALVDRIVESGAGNPFYIEEIVRMLIEDEVIDKGGSTWTVHPARLDEVRVPTTITGVLQTLLDALPPQERMVLQQAAVIGRVFWDAAVRALDAEAGLDVGRALDGLKRRELVVQRAEAMFGGTRELFFRNALLHEVAYESALLRHRKDWHLRTAAWLIDRAGHAADDVAKRIAEHFDRAGESRAAGLWYGRAARRAHAACSLDEAAHHYDRAIACWQAHDELAERRRELHQGLAEVLALRDAPPAPS